MALLALNQITTAFGGRVVLDAVDLRIEANQRIALLGRNGKAEAAPGTFDSTSGTAAVTATNTGTGAGVDASSNAYIGVAGTSVSGMFVWPINVRWGVWGSGDEIGVVGSSPAAGGTGVMGSGKPGVYGRTFTNNGTGVRGEGDAPGSIGVFGKNNPGRRALRTKGQVQMDCARTKTVSAKSNLVTLPAGVKAGTNAAVMATVQGNPGNDAVIWRAYRADSTHIRIVFNKTPANPVSVAYWVVHTG